MEKRVRWAKQLTIYTYNIQDKAVKNKVLRGIFQGLIGLKEKIALYYFLNF